MNTHLYVSHFLLLLLLSTSVTNTAPNNLDSQDITTIIDNYILDDNNNYEEKVTSADLDTFTSLQLSTPTVSLVPNQVRNIKKDSLIAQGPSSINSEPFEYTVTFTPASSYPVGSITLTDFLPTNLKLLQVHSETFALTTTHILDNQARLIFKNIQELNPDDTVSLILTVQVIDTTRSFFTHSAQVSSTTTGSSATTMSNIQVSHFSPERNLLKKKQLNRRNFNPCAQALLHKYCPKK